MNHDFKILKKVKEYQKEILVLISLLDFYIERGFKHKYLNENQLK